MKPSFSNLLSVLSACLIGHAVTAMANDTSDAVLTIRETVIRGDKLPSAKVLQTLPNASVLRILGKEGGWLLVETTATASNSVVKLKGWLRASDVNLQTDASAASLLSSGREAGGKVPVSLGVRELKLRSIEPRSNRHALIIGVGRYADPAVPPLPGVRFDKESATQMALAMQVPAANIRYLQNEEATGNGIRSALKDLTSNVQEGDRVFIHYSGHGSRYNDPEAGGCVEALLPYDGTDNSITNIEMTSLLQGITKKADKLFVMYDACHSGGLVRERSPIRTRGFLNANDDGSLRPKFAEISEECSRPVNLRTRGFMGESMRKGAFPQDIIHISAARDNEISFDDELKGGLATQFMRDCMLRDVKDLDNSGGITIDEIKRCAQEKINLRMANDANYAPHHLVLSGNADFVPTWFGHARLAGANQMAESLTPTSAPSNDAVAPGVSQPSTQVPSVSPTVDTNISGEQALRQMFNQRDAKRQVKVQLKKNSLKINQDVLAFSVQSDRAGYVYVALAGSDNQSISLIFPNELDRDNRIKSAQRLNLPGASWKMLATGPAGIDNLLVIVTDAPRDLSEIAQNKAGPFSFSLNDAQGRSQLGSLMSNSTVPSEHACTGSATNKAHAACSDAYGAAMVSVKEVK